MSNKANEWIRGQARRNTITPAEPAQPEEPTPTRGHAGSGTQQPKAPEHKNELMNRIIKSGGRITW